MSKNLLIKNKNRNITIMVISQVLLALFVGYWLNNQYQHQRENLSENLIFFQRRVLEDVVNRSVYECVLSTIVHHNDTSNLESIIFKKITFPERTRVNLAKDILKIIHENDSIIPKLDEYYSEDYPAPVPDENTRRIFHELFTLMHRYGIRSNYYEYQNNKATNSIPFNKENYKFLIAQYIKEKGINLEFNWVSEDQKIAFDKDMLAIRRFNNYDQKMEVDAYLTNYELYLLKNILPQIIFALVLFFITGFAFIFTYRGYVKQVKLNLLRADFINNITHELKIPVATAKAALEALRSFGIKADVNTTEEYLEMVSKEMNRLDSLTTRVLEHAKMEKRQSLKLQEVNLNDFLEGIVKSSNLLNNKATITFDGNKDKINATIDNVYIEGVIKNLIDNSIKYGGDDVSIKLNLWQNKGHAFISVKDNGPGIPKEFINKVFDKFFRVPKGDTHNVKGYGLGLSFVQLIMKQHNGTIKVENLKEGGCKFTLKFPV